MFLAMISIIPITYGQQSKNNDGVKVIYFHRTVRCNTCLEIDKIVKEVIQKNYGKEVDKKLISYQSIDFQQDDNALIRYYNVESPTLLIVKYKKGKEEIVNLTKDGFKYALSNPSQFKKIVIAKINELFR